MATSYQPAAGNAGLLGALLQPHSNYAALSGARSEALQLATYNTQLQQQQALETQAAAADQQAYIDKLNSIQFMGRDVAKLQAHVKNEEQQVFKEIKDDYKGDVREWYKVRGQPWMNGAATRLKQSPFYQQAVQNVQNVSVGQEAHNKGEYLTGQLTPNGFVTGEQQLQDFLAGRSDAYIHKGSYKLSDELKGIRDQYAPNQLPWVPTNATQEAIANHLIEKNGQDIGQDMYLRHYKGAQVTYKTDPLTKMYDFQRDQGRYAMEKSRYGMAVQDHAQMTRLRNQQMEENALDIKKKKGELNGADKSGMGFVVQQLQNPSHVIRFNHDPSAPKRLPSGIDVGQLTGLAATTLFGKADEALTRLLGLQKNKQGWSRGRISEGFTEQNGVSGFNLKNSNFQVLGVDPALYYNPADVPPSGKLNPNGVNGFARISVRFDSPYDAERAGLYNPNRVWGGDKPTSLWDTTTKSGTGVYDPETQTATFFTPTGSIDPAHNQPFSHAWRQASRGQRDANEDADLPYMNTSF